MYFLPYQEIFNVAQQQACSATVLVKVTRLFITSINMHEVPENDEQDPCKAECGRQVLIYINNTKGQTAKRLHLLKIRKYVRLNQSNRQLSDGK